MNEMVERVARAVRRRRIDLAGHRAADPVDNPTPHELALARAAIAAMREPTEAMLIAMREANALTAGNRLGLAYVAPDAAYAAAIDAALNDKKPGRQRASRSAPRHLEKPDDPSEMRPCHT